MKRSLCLFQICLTILVFHLLTISTTAQDITNGLVSRYTFSGNANDSQGTNNGNPTLQPGSSPTLQADRCGTANSAYSFDGNDIIVSQNPTNVTGSSYSYSMWVRLVSLPPSGTPGNINIGNPTILSLGNTGGDQFLSLANNYLGVSTGFSVGSYTSSTTSVGILTGTLPAINQWYFLTATRSATTLRLYIDGQLIGERNGLTAPFYNVPTNITIGGRHFPGPIQFFNGSIDDVRIYNRELTACEIDVLYRQNPGTQAVAFNTPFQTQPISGPAVVCPGITYNYTVNRNINPCPIIPAQVPQIATSTFNWTIPPGATIIGQGSNSISVTYPANFSAGTVSVIESTPICTYATSSISVNSSNFSCSSIRVTYVGSSSTYVGSPSEIATLDITNDANTAVNVSVTPIANAGFSYTSTATQTQSIPSNQTRRFIFPGTATKGGSNQLCFTVSPTDPCTNAVCTLSNQCRTIQALIGCPASWSAADFACGTDVLGTNGTIKNTTLSVHNSFFNVKSIDVKFSYDPSQLQIVLPIPAANILVPGATLSNVQAVNGQFNATLTFASKIDVLGSDGDGDPIYANFISIPVRALSQPPGFCYISTSSATTRFNIFNPATPDVPTPGSETPTDPTRINFSGAGCNCIAPDATFVISPATQIQGNVATFTANRNQAGDIHFWRVGENNNQSLGTIASPATYVYTKAGTYTITHTIQTVDNKTATTTKTITITSENKSLSYVNGTKKTTISNNSAYNFGRGNFTIEVVFKPNTTSTLALPYFFSKQNTDENGIGIGYNNLIGAEKGKIFAKLGLSAGQTNTSGVQILDGNCHSVALVRSNGTVTFYIDGKKGNTFTNSDSVNVTESITVGKSYRGEINELRIWSVARSQSDVIAKLNASLSGTEVGLAGYWTIEENTGQTIGDKSVNINNGFLGTNSSVETSDPAWLTLNCSVTPMLREAETVDFKSKIESPEELHTEVDFSVYPNPFEGDRGITIISTNTEIKQVRAQLVDITGNLKYSGNVTLGESFLSGTSLPAGVYILSIYSDLGTKRIRIVKI
jgi:hypothetical protein